MDKTAIKIAKLLVDKDPPIELGGHEYSLLELGFAPTFYQITEASIEAKVAFSSAESSEFSIGADIGVNVGYFAASESAS